MLTPRLRDALKYIEDEIERTGGVPPTYAMIATALGSGNKSVAQRVVAMLEERGYIRRLPNRARAIEVVRPSLQPYERRVGVTKPRCAPVPVMGYID